MAKIDEASINHCAVMLIDDITSNIYSDLAYEPNESKPEPDCRAIALMTLGNICGVLDMSRAMKEVLKS